MKKNRQSSIVNNQSLTIGWLYPDLMNTYGDRGNVMILANRAKWRGIETKVEQITVETDEKKLSDCDLVFRGGAQDTQQEIVNEDLLNNKGKTLIKMVEDGKPGLFICGAYQFLGKFYKTADGKKLHGLSLFNLYTENPGETAKRLIGNVVAKTKTGNIVGFENHGGRTYLEDKSQAFAEIVSGFGNNGEDNTEGIHYKNAIGTYFHGPILSKNPELADWFIQKALEIKYGEPFDSAQGKKIELEELDDSLEQKAKDEILNRLKQ